MDPGHRRSITFSVACQILLQGLGGETGFTMNVVQDASGIDNSRIFGAIGHEGMLERIDGLVFLLATCVEGAEIDPGVGPLRYIDGSLKLTLGGYEVFALFRCHGPYAMRLLRQRGSRALRQCVRLLEASANDGRSTHVVLAEVVYRGAVGRGWPPPPPRTRRAPSGPV